MPYSFYQPWQPVLLSHRLQQLISPEFIGKRLSDNCSVPLNDSRLTVRQ